MWMEPKVVLKMNRNSILLILVLFQLNVINVRTEEIDSDASSSDRAKVSSYPEFKDRALFPGRDYDLVEEANSDETNWEEAPYNNNFHNSKRDELIYFPTRYVHLMREPEDRRPYDPDSGKLENKKAFYQGGHLTPARYNMYTGNDYEFNSLYSRPTRFRPATNYNPGRERSDDPVSQIPPPERPSTNGPTPRPEGPHNPIGPEQSPENGNKDKIVIKMDKNLGVSSRNPEVVSGPQSHPSNLGNSKTDPEIDLAHLTNPQNLGGPSKNPEVQVDPKLTPQTTSDIVPEPKPDKVHHSKPKKSKSKGAGIHPQDVSEPEFSSLNPSLPKNDDIYKKVKSIINVFGKLSSQIPGEQTESVTEDLKTSLYPVLKDLINQLRAKTQQQQEEEPEIKSQSQAKVPEPSSELTSETEPQSLGLIEQFKQFISPIMDSLGAFGQQNRGPESTSNSSEVLKSSQKVLSDIVQDFMKGAKRVKRQLGVTSSIVTVITSLFQLGFNTFGSIIRAIFQFISSLLSYLPQFLP